MGEKQAKWSFFENFVSANDVDNLPPHHIPLKLKEFVTKLSTRVLSITNKTIMDLCLNF